MSTLTGSLWDPSHLHQVERSVFEGNATEIECSHDDPLSAPGQLLLAGSLGATVVFFLIGYVSCLGEAAANARERPLATNPMGSFLLIPPFYVAMGAIIGWRVVDCTLGCSSWAESAPSISFFTANIMGEGYVLLFVMLVLMAYIFFERVDTFARNRVEKEAERKARGEAGGLFLSWTSLAGEWIARWGFALTTITGIMPSLASNCHLQPSHVYEFCWKEEMSNPHGMGISIGIGLTFIGLQLRAIAPIYSGITFSSQGDASRKAHSYALRTLMISNVLYALMVAFFYIWLGFLFSGGPNPRAVDMCILHRTRDECTGASLPIQQQIWADQREGGWQCRWDPNVDYYRYPCTKFNCDAGGHLLRNKYSIIFEFLGFLYWAVATAGMTQAIDIMDDVPVNVQSRGLTTKRWGRAGMV